jgi:hypothetical protein
VAARPVVIADGLGAVGGGRGDGGGAGTFTNYHVTCVAIVDTANLEAKVEGLQILCFFALNVYQVHGIFQSLKTMTNSLLPFGEIFWARRETPLVLERHRRAR